MPVTDDVRLFEKLSLEGFQSGLSWLTILRKREAFRRAFAGFDFRQVARFGARDVERLLEDASIVRHRGKIESTINNAQRAVELVEAEGSLAAFVWRFEPTAAERPRADDARDALRARADRRLARAREGAQAARLDVRRADDRRTRSCRRWGSSNDHLEGCSRGRASRPRAPPWRARLV